jgi:hypothetical protein
VWFRLEVRQRFLLSPLYVLASKTIFLIRLDLGESCAWPLPMPVKASPQGVIDLLKASRW